MASECLTHWTTRAGQPKIGRFPWRRDLPCAYHISLKYSIFNIISPATLPPPFNGLFSRTTWLSRHQKGKPFWFYWSKRLWGDSSFSWTICKSFAPHSRQITTSVPHHSDFYRPDSLSDNQPTVSKHWRHIISIIFDILHVMVSLHKINTYKYINITYILSPALTGGS